MTKTAYIHGQVAALRHLGFHKQANDLDMMAQLAAAEAAPAAGAGGAAAAKGGFFSKIRNAKLPMKAGIGIGALAGGGLLAHQLMQPPQMDVVPSAPISPLFP